MFKTVPNSPYGTNPTRLKRQGNKGTHKAANYPTTHRDITQNIDKNDGQREARTPNPRVLYPSTTCTLCVMGY